MSIDHTSARAFRVILYSDDSEVIDHVVGIIGALSHIRVGVRSVSAFMSDKASGEAIDTVILDVGDGTVLRDENLYGARKRFARIPFLIISNTVDTDAVRGIMKLDARDFLKSPVDGRQLISAIDQQLGGAAINTSHVSAVMGAVGGCGSTTMAITAADILSSGAKRLPHHTCLVDLDFSSGACGYYLDVLNEYDLTPVLDAPDRVDAEFLDLIKKDVRPGFSVLSFLYEDLPYHPNASEFVLRMLDIVSYQYRNVVIDLPYWHAPWRMSLLEGADDVYVLGLLTIPAMWRVRDLCNEIARRRGGNDGLSVVVNRYQRRLFSMTITRRELRKIFKDRPVQFVSDDHATIVEAINRGVSPLEISRSSAYVKDVRAVIGKKGGFFRRNRRR